MKKFKKKQKVVIDEKEIPAIVKEVDIFGNVVEVISKGKVVNVVNMVVKSVSVIKWLIVLVKALLKKN